MLIKGLAPHDALLGRIPGREGLFKLHRHPDARAIEGLTLWLFQGSLLFFNAEHVKDRLDSLAASLPAGSWFVLDASAVVDVDTTAAAMLEDALGLFEAKGICFGIAECTASRFFFFADRACWSASDRQWSSMIWKMPAPRSSDEPPDAWLTSGLRHVTRGYR